MHVQEIHANCKILLRTHHQVGSHFCFSGVNYEYHISALVTLQRSAALWRDLVFIALVVCVFLCVISIKKS